jgi:hypothetical protein
MLLWRSASDSLVASDQVADVEERDVASLVLVLTPIATVTAIAALVHGDAVAAFAPAVPIATVLVHSAVVAAAEAPVATNYLRQLLLAEDVDVGANCSIGVLHDVLNPFSEFFRSAMSRARRELMQLVCQLLSGVQLLRITDLYSAYRQTPRVWTVRAALLDRPSTVVGLCTSDSGPLL